MMNNSISSENYLLSNEIPIPKLGLGTWMIDDGDAAKAVRCAVELGYRHIDTAQGYGNERGVGEGVRTCGLPREDIFVTSKLDASIKDYRKTVDAINESIQKTGLGYLDMLLIHSPQPWDVFRGSDHFLEGNREAWRALEEAYKAGRLRAIGVSNFEKVDLDNILDQCSVPPMVNQILAHAGNMPFELINYSKSRNILVEAYSPVAHGEILNHGWLARMAGKYRVEVPQLCIRYCLQLDLLPLPKTANPLHMAANIELDFEIKESDMEELKNMQRISDYGSSSHFPVFGGSIN